MAAVLVEPPDDVRLVLFAQVTEVFVANEQAAQRLTLQRRESRRIREVGVGDASTIRIMRSKQRSKSAKISAALRPRCRSSVDSQAGHGGGGSSSRLASSSNSSTDRSRQPSSWPVQRLRFD
jgi:hypothetical protein